MTHVTSDGVVEVEAEMDTEVEAAVEAGRTETSAFSGKPLVIEQGMVVTWVNNDSVSHTISSDLRGSLFAAVVIAPGESFSYQFDRPGTYHYYGEAQDRMKGTVVVSESGLSEEQPPEEEQPPQEQPPQEQPPQEQPPQQQKPQDQQQQQQPIPSPSPTASPSPSPDPSQSPSPSPSPDQE